MHSLQAKDIVLIRLLKGGGRRANRKDRFDSPVFVVGLALLADTKML